VSLLSTAGIEANTDHMGVFEFSNLKGTYLTIRNISAEGYEYHRKYQDHKNFEYWAEIESNRFVQDIHEPVVFKVRKMNKPIYLLRGELTWKLKKDIIYYMDLARTKIFTEDDPRYIRDVMLSTMREGDVYRVSLEMLDDSAGMLLREQPLYTAPEVGYEKKKTIEIEVGSRKELYIIVMTSNGIFSRLDGKLYAHQPVVIFSIESFLNPFGERNLEIDKDIPEELRVKLREETKSLLVRGMKAKKPDRYINQ
jgi:hypothetical protein